MHARRRTSPVANSNMCLPLAQDAPLLHIAEAAMCAPLPPGWTVHLDAAGAEYFHCIATQVRGHMHAWAAESGKARPQKRVCVFVGLGVPGCPRPTAAGEGFFAQHLGHDSAGLNNQRGQGPWCCEASSPGGNGNTESRLPSSCAPQCSAWGPAARWLRPAHCSRRRAVWPSGIRHQAPAPPAPPAPLQTSQYAHPMDDAFRRQYLEAKQPL